MKLFSLTTLAVVALVFSLQSQSYQVRWGKTIKQARSNTSYSGLVGTSADAYYIFSSSTKKSTVQTYNWTHRQIDDYELSFDPQYAPYLLLEHLAHTSSTSLAVFSRKDLKRRTRYTYFSTVTEESIEAPQLIHEAAFEDADLHPSTRVAKLKVPQADRIQCSPDSSLVVFAAQNFTHIDEQEHLVITIKTYDENIAPNWGTTLKLPYKRYEAGLVRLLINNRGEVYALLAVDNRRGATPDASSFLPHRYELLKITEDTTLQLTPQLSDTTSIKYADLYLPPGDNQQLVLAGMYTDLDTRGNLKGAFHLTIDEDFSVASNQASAFTAALIKGVTDNTAADAYAGLNDRFTIQSFFRLSNGDHGFIAEETYTTQEQRIVVPGSKTIFHSDKLLIILFSPNGELFKTAYVDKDHASESSGHTSFLAHVIDDQLILVFNDDKTRAERQELQLYGRFSAVPTDLVVLNKYLRTIHQQLLFTDESVGAKRFLPRASYGTPEGLLLYTRGENNLQCGFVRM